VRKPIVAVVLALLLIAMAPGHSAVYAVAQQSTIDPCTACNYIPQWCWLCYMFEWWDLGCYPGDPGCLDW
jgi:hypothetical protein